MKKVILLKLICMLALLSYPAYAQNNSPTLKELLDFQNSNQNQNELVSSRAENEALLQSPIQSTWLTTVDGTLEFQNNVNQRFEGRGETVTDSLPFNAQLQQKTPYGVTLNLEYRRELLDPDFLGTFTKERYRGTLEFSLINDFLGKNSRLVDGNLKRIKNVYKVKANLDQCRDISLKYNEAIAFQENLSVTKETISETEEILSGLRRAARTGAVNKTTVSLMEIDVDNLKAQKSTTLSNKLRSLTELQTLSGFNLKTEKLIKLDTPALTIAKKDLSNSIQIEILKQELTSLKARLAKLDLDRNYDVSLFAGLESTSFVQNVINLDGQTDFGLVGIQANLRFSDKDYSYRKKQLRAQIRIKENELRLANNLLEIENKRFQETLNNFQKAHQTLKQGLSTLKNTEKRSFRNFRSGKSSYNEFLTSRNEILRYKRSLIETKKNFWDSYFNLYHFQGDGETLCMKGSKS